MFDLAIVPLRQWLAEHADAMVFAPGLLMVAYLLGGLPFYAWYRSRNGRWLDGEIEARGATPLLGMEARLYFSWVMRPVWNVVVRSGVPAHSITTLSVLLAFAAAVAVATGCFGLGGWLYLLAGCCDFIDGRLARASGKAGPFGAALDSVLDRYCEMAFFAGLAWFYRDSWVLAATLAALIGSALVPYVRARGEALGVAMTEPGSSRKQIGVMQRTERIVVIGGSVLFSPLLEWAAVWPSNWPRHTLAAGAIVLAAIATQFTALQRLFGLLNAIERQSGRRPPRWLASGSLARSLAAAFVATALDFTVTVASVHVIDVSPALATLIGCACGGILNFGLNRLWTFRSDGSYIQQGSRYTFVSASSALLNSGGVAVLGLLPGLDFRLAWVIVRGAVFIAWNYPLHRDYVFTPSPAVAPTIDRPDLARQYR